MAGYMHGMRGACMAGGCVAGWWGGGHAWQGVVWQGGGGGMHGRGCAWQKGHAWQGGMRGRGVCMAGEMATAADGTHPTGMHSC